MSFPYPSRSVTSSSQSNGGNTPLHAATGNQRPPGLNPSSDDSRGTGMMQRAISDRDLAPRNPMDAILSIRERLQSRNEAPEPDLKEDIAIFRSIKDAQADIENALWQRRDAPEMRRLRKALQPFLLRVAADFAKPVGRDKHNADPVAFLDLQQVRTLCHGLSVCASSWAGLLFDTADLGELRPALQQITDRLLERAMQLGFPQEVGANGTTPDILNWVSRALKHGLIASSESIRSAFERALPLMKEWIGIGSTDAASSSNGPYLSSYQLGKCAVQIDTMLKFRLIAIDDHRRSLEDCILALCGPAMRTHLTKRPVDSVAIVSIGNLAKDLLEAGILDPEEEPHLEALAGAMQMMGCIPAEELLAGDCRSLSNCCNFLRALDVHGVAALPGFSRHRPRWHAACDTLTDCLASKPFAAALPDAQAVSNLISFVKCRARRLQQDEDSDGEAMAGLRSAASCLAQHFVGLDGAGLHSTETGSGLLSGLAYLLDAGLVPDTPALRSAIAQVMKNLGQERTKMEAANMRRALLQAIGSLVLRQAITLDDAQSALSQLLGPASNPEGYTLADLQRECRSPGAEEKRSAVLALHASAKDAARSASQGIASGWQQPQKTFKAARLVPALSNAPMLTAAPDVKEDDDESEAPASRTARARTMTTSNAATTTSTATQPVAPFAAASRVDIPQPGRHKRRKNRNGDGMPPGQAHRKAAMPTQQWFALIGDGVALEELQRLAADPAVRNAREGSGKVRRGALFHALVHGRKDVVAWLMQPETGYVPEGDAGALLDAACRELDLLEDRQLASIACFIDALDKAASAEVGRFYSDRDPVYAQVRELLLSRKIIEARSSPDWSDKLVDAVEKRDIALVKRLLKNGVNPDGKDRYGYTALMCAAESGYLEVVETLLAKAKPILDQANRNGETALLLACKAGHAEVARKLLDAGAKPDLPAGNGTTPLMHAAECGHLAVVQQLLEAGASVDMTHESGLTALMCASRNGHADVVRELLLAGAQMNHANKRGITALMHACGNGRLAVVRELLDARARVDQEDGEGTTALMFASSSGHADIVQMLLEAGPRQQVDRACREGDTALICASSHGHVDAVRTLLHAGAQVNQANKLGFTALMRACGNGRLAVARELLEAKAQVDQEDNNGYTALIFASAHGHADIVQALLEAQTKPQVNLVSRSGANPLICAAGNGHVDVVHRLLHAGAEVNQASHLGATALMRACANGHLAVVKQLLDAKAWADQEDREGFTALMFASRNGHADIVQTLLEAEPELKVDQVNDRGATPLLCASGNGHIEVVRKLLHAGATVNKASHAGATALMRACGNGHLDVARELLDAKAQVDRQDKGGSTALMFASRVGRSDIVRLLMASEPKPRVDQTDGNGNTAMMLACGSGHLDVVRELRNAGAQVNHANTLGLTPLMCACTYGHLAVAKELLDAGAQMDREDREGFTALTLASQYGRVDIVRALLEAMPQVGQVEGKRSAAPVIVPADGRPNAMGKLQNAAARANHANSLGLTPLMYACANGDLPIVKELLNAGAWVDQQDKEGLSALMFASQHAHLHVVKALLAARPQVDQRNLEGVTALMFACMRDHAEVVHALVDAGASVNQPDHRGVTALMYAAETDRLDLVEKLLDAGALPDQPNHEGWTALMFASKLGRPEIAQAMRRRSAQASEALEGAALRTSGQ